MYGKLNSTGLPAWTQRCSPGAPSPRPWPQQPLRVRDYLTTTAKWALKQTCPTILHVPSANPIHSDQHSHPFSKITADEKGQHRMAEFQQQRTCLHPPGLLHQHLSPHNSRSKVWQKTKEKAQNIQQRRNKRGRLLAPKVGNLKQVYSDHAENVVKCKAHNILVGADPGLPDVQHFGRREIKMSPEELAAMTRYQVGALQAFLTAADHL